MVREGIAAVCDAKPQLHVVGQCSDGVAAMNLIQSMRPDLAVIDLHLPKLHSLELIRKVFDSNCTTKVIVLSTTVDEKAALGVLRSGASGFLVKEEPARHLLDAISHILEGGVYVSPLLAASRLFAAPGKISIDDPVSLLSPRELEVFSFLVEGLRAKDIAQLLDISPKTVDSYRSSLMRKLDIHHLAGLVKLAMQRDSISKTTP